MLEFHNLPLDMQFLLRLDECNRHGYFTMRLAGEFSVLLAPLAKRKLA